MVLLTICLCVVGIVLATDCTMIAGNCFPEPNGFDIRAVGIAAVLSAILLTSRNFYKKKTSPITLILIAGVLGAIVYGV